MAMTKRKGMEIICHGSPQKILAREGQCHRVSPIAKRHRDLRPFQIGIKKSLAQTFEVGADLQGIIDAAVAKAFAEEKKKSLIFEEDVKENLVTGITMRSLVSDWSKTNSGKEDLHKMTTAVNRSYAEGRMGSGRMLEGHDLPYHHKVQHGELLTDIKHLIKQKEVGQEAIAGLFLEKARMAIESSSGLSGTEFLDLVSAYVHTNEQVHVKWNADKLKHVLDLAKGNQLQVAGHTPVSWIRLMVIAIAKDRGWEAMLET